MSTLERYSDGEIDEEDFRKEVAPIRKRRAQVEEGLEKLLTEKYHVTTTESVRRDMLAENKHMDTFDEDTVRRMVGDIFLEADGTVNVVFKATPHSCKILKKVV